ncbi:HAD superfamily hydrolase (TIGR01490 family) [Friedmanniella endophytica]|uniref:HAD superfamily hydrolase (TIGR01490 family) n=1 Tax=Microlunatus kandeliicorticis TaxID=1759536 RepID=A0A7W3ITU4_9ACTN|nr:HAD-IB family hydrolase [Microlunatus kandeliicorticis]MBA8795157.1 HAD superfamily hydrolase (TIGR01490 family) [Microlunatus kandeliicorticis]
MTVAPAETFQRATAADHPGPTVDGRLRDLLAGKVIVMTGVTGFIGEQLLWKMLVELPDTTVAVLVRRKGSASARDRTLAVVRKKIFAGVREAAGGPEALLEQRIRVIEGDLPNVPALPRDLDVVVHCAGDVSFDPPIDQAFRTNVIGTEALMDRMLEACTGEDGELVRIPHYVQISTAYTAGRRRGAIGEAPHAHDIDYRAETAAGLAMRDLIEAESRTSAQLTRLRKEAERDHRAAGYLTTAADTERRRKEWVQAKLVEAGTERARSLGWTDVYTFTKALGERVVADKGAHIRTSVVRPSIVESSLVHPYPGWIEGFKMAEPLILAYGRGELPEFPASPDSVIDVVPCDHVVNATIAVCATEPEIGVCEYYHVSSGARNPITFSGFYIHIRNYFLAHPFEGGARGAARLPQWKFPGAASVERLLSTSERAHALADRAVLKLPRSERTRKFARDLDRTRSRLDFLRRYLSLYNEYAQSELHFVDDNTLRLSRSLDPADQPVFACDTAVVDWTEYVERIHCPSITAPVRRLDALRRKRGSRASTWADLSSDEGMRRAKADPEAHRVLAAFDLDGTIMSTNVIEQYLWSRLPELDRAHQLAELGSVLRSLPSYLRVERRDRGAFLRAVYRRYAGADLAALEEFVDTTMAGEILGRLSPDAVRRVREHREAGHTTILITGCIRPLTRPLAPLFDVIVAADLAVDARGRCTGFLTGPPLVGESRAAWLNHYASLHDMDLSRSFAYADSHSDLPMLSCVGRPVAVSPDVPLMRAAAGQSWTTVEWKIRPQNSRWTLSRLTAEERTDPPELTGAPSGDPSPAPRPVRGDS